MIIQVSFESKWWTVTKCNMNSASSSLKSFSVTCASRAAFVADSCEDSVSSQLSHTQTPQTIYCGMLNSYWTSVLLVELKSSSSSQHWFHSPSQLSGHPAIQAAGQPFFLFLFLGTFQMGVWVWVSIRHEIWRRLPRSRKLPGGFMCFSTELPLSRLH